jgi:anti-anti-sigma regulatory factor
MLADGSGQLATIFKISMGGEVGAARAFLWTGTAPMMKVQVTELDDRLILHVEGRLAGAFVPVLANSWSTARAGRPDRKISVDLKDVTCIDRSGRSLLQRMHRDGVGFLRAGIAVQDILEQIMEHHECQQ